MSPDPTAASPELLEWAASGHHVFDALLSLLKARDAGEHGRVLRDLQAGGRLRLVMDDPVSARGSSSLRIRLICATGRNRWIYKLPLAAQRKGAAGSALRGLTKPAAPFFSGRMG